MLLNPSSIVAHNLRNQLQLHNRHFFLQPNNLSSKWSSNGQLKSLSFKSGIGENGKKTLWKRIKDKYDEKVLLLGRILTTQCNFVVSLRLRRMAQICGLYNRIYSEQTVMKMVEQLMLKMRARAVTLRQRKPNSRSLRYLLSAAAVFCWDRERITDEEMDESVDEFRLLECGHACGQEDSKDNTQNGSSSPGMFNISASSSFKDEEVKEERKAYSLSDEGWEPVIVRDNLQVWRRVMNDSYLYQYKVFGSFEDVPARSFFQVQMDTEYRKVWDKLVIKLDVIEKEELAPNQIKENYLNDMMNEEDTGNEVIHWVMKYPYPMYCRDYVYVRRSKIDNANNLMILVSKSINHPKAPESKDFVRVKDYASQMVIRPHRSFDDCGFDYMLTYFDDPQSAFPRPAYNWMASCGVPDFVDKLHAAAVQLHNTNVNNKLLNIGKQQSKTYSTPKTSNTCNTCNPNANQTSSSQCIYA